VAPGPCMLACGPRMRPLSLIDVLSVRRGELVSCCMDGHKHWGTSQALHLPSEVTDVHLNALADTRRGSTRSVSQGCRRREFKKKKSPAYQQVPTHGAAAWKGSIPPPAVETILGSLSSSGTCMHGRFWKRLDSTTGKPSCAPKQTTHFTQADRSCSPMKSTLTPTQDA
jgi:hypothetical protein